MAVSLDAIGDVESHSNHRLVKRLNLPPSHTVYNFTFDYDFAVLKDRADSKDVLFRLDYSNDPGYWEDVVGESSSQPMKQITLTKDPNISGGTSGWTQKEIRL